MIGDVRGKGLFQAIEFVRDRTTRARFPDARRPGRQGRPAGTRARTAVPVRPSLDRVRPAAGRRRRSRSTQMVAILDRSLGEVLAELDSNPEAASRHS